MRSRPRDEAAFTGFGLAVVTLGECVTLAKVGFPDTGTADFTRA
jgi:hypothetical protein